MKECELKPAPYNPRKIEAKALDGLAASVAEFGDLSGIVWNKRTGHVVAGHQRIKALKAKGATFDGQTNAYVLGKARFPVRVVDWSDTVERAANITANNPHIAGDFTAEIDDLLKELEADFDGFADLNLGELLGAGGATDPDDVPEHREAVVSKPGDLWVMGEHRLLCGDCTAPDGVRALLGGAAFDTVTDPPYGIGCEYQGHDDNNSHTNASLVANAMLLFRGGWIWTPGQMNLARELARWPDARALCWHKGFAAAGNGLGGASTWEPVLVRGVKGGRLPNDYLHFGTDREPGLRDSHPCPKPVALYVHLIRHLTVVGVYEPFCGSGTTIIAAEQLGRKCYAIEIAPQYVDVAVRRWQNFTEQEATLDGDARTFAEIEKKRTAGGQQMRFGQDAPGDTV